MLGPSVLLTLINIVFGFIEALLGLRLVLRLLGAGGAPFVQWIYDTSVPLIAPFKGMFPNQVLNGGNVLEINTLIALLIYAVVGYVFEQSILFITYHTSRYYDTAIVEDDEVEVRRPKRRIVR